MKKNWKRLAVFALTLALVLTTLSVAALGEGGATPGQVKERLEGRHWAYSGTNAEVLASLKEELWDVLSHEFPGIYGPHADPSDPRGYSDTYMDGIVTLTGDGTTTTESEFNIAAGTLCPYYTAAVTLSADPAVTAQFTVYILNNENECVVRTSKDGADDFTVLHKTVSGEDFSLTTVTTDLDPSSISATSGNSGRMAEVQFCTDYDMIEVFGNGVMTGMLAESDYHCAFHVFCPTDISTLNFRIGVFKPTCLTAKIVPSRDHGTAAALDEMGLYPVTSVNNSQEWPTYFGNSSVTISAVSFGGLVALTNVTTTNPGATITGSGPWTVTFGSVFYDEIPLTLTFEDGSSNTVSLMRVGIDIKDYGKVGDELSREILHGTQMGPEITWGEDNYAVTATFYYPTGSAYEATIVANYVWQDGTRTTETISKFDSTAADSVFVAADDFLLYKGSRDEAPESVYVTAISGGLSGESFGGTKLGSGAGVLWTYGEY